MKLTQLMKQANPVPTTDELSARGRAELRALVGADTLPLTTTTRTEVIRTSSPIRTDRFRTPVRWLAPALAALLTLAGVGVGVVLSGRSNVGLVPYAFADTVTATIMDGQITPIPLGASLIFDIPFPESPGHPQVDKVVRVWLAAGDGVWTHWGWVDVPDSLTFRLRTTADGVGFYQAENWPYDQIYELAIIGSQSSKCSGGGLPYDLPASAKMASTSIYMCDFGMAMTATPTDSRTLRPYDEFEIAFRGWGSESKWGTMTTEISAITEDPATTIARIQQFEMGADGYWAELPEGYEGWSSWSMGLPTGPCGIAVTPLPTPGQLSPGSYCFAVPNSDEGVFIGVTDSQTCFIKMGEDHLNEVRVTHNEDGTCSYTP